MVTRAFVMDIRRLWNRQELWVVLVVGALFAVMGIVETNYVNGLFTTLHTVSSMQTSSMLGNSQVGNVLFALLPLLATFPCAWFYYSDCESHMVPILISRLGRRSYYSGRTLAISVSAFVVSVFPYLLNLVFSLIAYPFPAYGLNANFVYKAAPASSENVFNVLFPQLYMNEPILHALSLILLLGVYSTLMALLSFGLTLYYRKNMAIALASTTVIGFISILLLNVLKQSDWVLPLQLTTDLLYSRGNLYIVLLEFAVLLFINLGLIGSKVIIDRDVLP